MSYRLEVRPQVWNDIAAAAEWDDARKSGLGAKFARARIEDVRRQPLLPRIRDTRRSVRWVFPRRFPYRIEGDVLLIIAVIHAAQHDRHWKERVRRL